MHIKKSRRICLLLAIVFCFPVLAVGLQEARAEESAPQIQSIVNDILQWEASRFSDAGEEALLCPTLLSAAGTTDGDWLPFALARLGRSDRYDDYLQALQKHVEDRYQNRDTLDNTRATEWHRIALVCLALGGDPTAFGADENGDPIDLLADGTYRCTQLTAQGINSLFWGLLVLDSFDFSLPSEGQALQAQLVQSILQKQQESGGFALSGTQADPDLTAMAIQALAPHRDDPTVQQAIEKAVARLSEMQTSRGDFPAWGGANAGSVAQVIIALCCLDIDPLTEERFIKDGHTLLDALLQFRLEDGSFAHTLQQDGENRSNAMATEQALCALVALLRQQNGLRTLYDLRAETEALPEPPVISVTETVSRTQEISATPITRGTSTAIRGIVFCSLLLLAGLLCLVLCKRRKQR